MSDNESKKYTNFFEEVGKFKKEQEKQKQRGLNDYNVMTAIRKSHAEVGMHSNFIHSLLNINGLHYQGDLFAKLFVEHALLYEDFGKIKEVQMEEDADGRRIDFTIKSDKFYIGIEMKIYAGDQPNQISDYYNDLTIKANKDKNQIVEIFYLTLDGKEASPESCNNTKYNKMSFEWDILNWLEASKKEVQNITNLNNAIGYYTDVVKQLTNKYESPINKYKDFFLNQKNYELYEKFEDEISKQFDYADEIKSGYEDAKQKLYNDYFSFLFEPILKQYKDLNFEYYDLKNQKLSFSFQTVYDIGLMINSNGCKSIYIAPNWNNLHWQGNPACEKELTEINDFLIDNEVLSEYKIGKIKGKSLKDNSFSEPISIERLFKKELVQIDLQEIINNIEIMKKPLK